MAPIILYDLPSRGRRACWSLNPWKTRMALNFKGVDYKTEWLEYPDVAPTLQAAGLPPNDGAESTPYSIPAVRFPDGTYVMESLKIARELEKRHPEPALHPDADIVSQVISVMSTITKPLGPVYIPRVARDVLTEKSQLYFNETRQKRFGMPLDQLEKERGGDVAWAAVKEPIQNLAALLNKTDGPYFSGDQVSYADLIVVSFLQFAKVLGQDVYDRVVAHDKAFDDLYKLTSKWLERDDH